MRPATSRARWLLAVWAETPARAASSLAGRASPPARARHMAARDGSARSPATNAMFGSMCQSLAPPGAGCFTAGRSQMCVQCRGAPWPARGGQLARDRPDARLLVHVGDGLDLEHVRREEARLNGGADRL